MGELEVQVTVKIRWRIWQWCGHSNISLERHWYKSQHQASDRPSETVVAKFSQKLLIYCTNCSRV